MASRSEIRSARADTPAFSVALLSRLMWSRRRRCGPAYTACFSSLATRKATFVLALILMASPVAGLRPILAARFRT